MLWGWMQKEERSLILDSDSTKFSRFGSPERLFLSLYLADIRNPKGIEHSSPGLAQPWDCDQILGKH
ncbi:hypothetical protein NT6N_15070 [Oceaniferula spumae]|uniref:Uncharacterized protein n=1 Tax=Oceaniferula spumae TaxID=2979115 RepID=A0AAT9FKK4_9BACT